MLKKEDDDDDDANIDCRFSNYDTHRRINAFHLAAGTIERRPAVSGELFTSACGHFTEELPVVFSLARIEKSEKVGKKKSPALTAAPGCDCSSADGCRQRHRHLIGCLSAHVGEGPDQKRRKFVYFFEKAAAAA